MLQMYNLTTACFVSPLLLQSAAVIVPFDPTVLLVRQCKCLDFWRLLCAFRAVFERTGNLYGHSTSIATAASQNLRLHRLFHCETRREKSSIARDVTRHWGDTRIFIGSSRVQI